MTAGSAPGSAGGPRRGLGGLVGATAARHAAVVALAAALVLTFAWVHGQWSLMHRWNRAFGDASMVLVALAMAVGPASRLWRPTRRALPFRREFGIWATLAALVHTVIILAGWVEWELLRLFGYEFHPGLGRYVMLQQGFALANAIGFFALMLAGILAVTSNDASLRRLGSSGWKVLQMGAVPLWWLTMAHVGYFLFAHFLSFHRELPDPSPLQWPFAVLVIVVLAIRIGAYAVTVRAKAAPRAAEPAAPQAGR